MEESYKAACTKICEQAGINIEHNIESVAKYIKQQKIVKTPKSVVPTMGIKEETDFNKMIRGM